jgi:hypothetical protein
VTLKDIDHIVAAIQNRQFDGMETKALRTAIYETFEREYASTLNVLRKREEELRDTNAQLFFCAEENAKLRKYEAEALAANGIVDHARKIRERRDKLWDRLVPAIENGDYLTDKDVRKAADLIAHVDMVVSPSLLSEKIAAFDKADESARTES